MLSCLSSLPSTLLNRRLGVAAAAGLILLMQAACSDGDNGEPQEPVSPTAEATPYPEDPDMAKADKKDNDTAAAKPDDAEAVGNLTDNPFKGKKPEGDDVAAAPAAEKAPATDNSDAVGGALNDNAPTYEAAPEATPSGPEGQTASGKHGKGGTKHHAAATHEKATRYVRAMVLNVRSKPNAQAPVVKHILGGAELTVEVHGAWSKIKGGQWVRSKYLSETPTRKFTKAEAMALIKGDSGGKTGAAKTQAKAPKAGKKKKTTHAAAKAEEPAAGAAVPADVSGEAAAAAAPASKAAPDAADAPAAAGASESGSAATDVPLPDTGTDPMPATEDGSEPEAPAK